MEDDDNTEEVMKIFENSESNVDDYIADSIIKENVEREREK